MEPCAQRGSLPRRGSLLAWSPEPRRRELTDHSCPFGEGLMERCRVTIHLSFGFQNVWP